MKNQLLSVLSLMAIVTLTACDLPSITINVNESKTEEAATDVTLPQSAVAPPTTTAPNATVTKTQSPRLSEPAVAAAQNFPSTPNLVQIAFDQCHGSYVLETMESLDFTVTICYSPENLVPSYYVGMDKDTEEMIVLPIAEYDNSDWTHQYLARNGDYSYAIASDSQKWPNGALIVRQGSQELLRQPFNFRELVLEGGQVNW